MTIYAKSAIGEQGEKEPLAEHTIHDLQVADTLVNNLPFTEYKKSKIRKDLRLAVAFHDVGKAATGFQDSLERGAPYWGRRHEILSAVFASVLGLKEEIIFAVLTHHKSLPSDGIDAVYGCLPDEQIPYTPNHIAPVWNQMAEEWQKNIVEFSEEWRKICLAIGRKDLVLSRSSPVDLTSLSDNMGNNWIQRYNQVESIPFKQRYYASLLRGLLISADHIASSHSSMPVRIPDLNDSHMTTNNIPTPQNLRGFQKRAYKNIGNLILRAPTGSGKTLAAMLWAKRNQKYNGRLFYALPTIASINAMYLRLKEYFGEDSRHDGSGNNNKNNNKDNVVGLLHSAFLARLFRFCKQICFQGRKFQSKLWKQD
jgi:CRISPR-associated endonuclease/helicase Cas3